MIPIEELDKIGAYAESVGFDYRHSSNKRWVDFIDKTHRKICVEFDDVKWDDHVGIHFLCADHVNPSEARAIYQAFPDALKILEMLEKATKIRRPMNNGDINGNRCL